MELIDYGEGEKIFYFTIRLFEEGKPYDCGEFTEVFGIHCFQESIFDCSISFKGEILQAEMACIYEVIWVNRGEVSGSVFANIALKKESNLELIELIVDGRADCDYMFSVTEDEWENIDSDRPQRTICKIDKIPMLIFTEEEK